jgi:hypothetical protein
MKRKDTPIRFNAEMQEKEKELALILGIDNTYGEVPAVVRFCINYTLSRLKSDQKFIPDLNPSEIDTWFLSIKKLNEKEKTQKEIEKLQKQV